MRSLWRIKANEAIDRAHLTVRPGAAFAERKKIIDAAYPFGERALHPYKIWLSARKIYLAKHDPNKPKPALPESPLERAKRISTQTMGRT